MSQRRSSLFRLWVVYMLLAQMSFWLRQELFGPYRWFSERSPSAQGFLAIVIPIGVAFAAWVIVSGWRAIRGRLTPASLRNEWLQEAQRFRKLAEEDHYHLQPGTPMPGGIEKVHAMMGWKGWYVGGGLSDYILRQVEAQCHSAGNLLRHTRRARPKKMLDNLQAWIQFLVDSGQASYELEGTSTGPDGTTQTERAAVIEVVTIASENVCRMLAAAEPPA